ncbi:MAG: hypothetical protein PUB42_06560, partial [Firmicutes bacterium]|nr:hypothetical protein [Bacillota bacterium]
KQNEIDIYTAGMDSQITNTENYYDKQIGDVTAQYEKNYERNAVQKLINEKQIAEKNANLGLTDSGLNRTQQSAVQMSYANQKASLDSSRQKVLDELNIKLTEAITALQNENQSGIMQIENKWDSYSEQQGANAYNSKLQYYKDLINSENDALTKLEQSETLAAADIQKAQINANKSGSKSKNDTLLWNFTGTYDSYGNPVFINSNGKTQAFGEGVNPYTGTKNKDAKYGTFSNGYQPNNIGGTKLKNSSMQTDITGKTQTVWYTEEKDATGKTVTRYWLWRGNLNRYVELDISELGL